MQTSEAKEPQTSATKVAHPDTTNTAVHPGLFAMPDIQGSRHVQTHLPSSPLSERQMVVPKNPNVLEDNVTHNFQKREVVADYNWAVKKKKMEQRISACVEKIKGFQGRKKFAFVRFIKVSNINVLVGNLNTIWIGKFKLRFNLARFQRGSINGGVKDVEQKQHVRVNVPATSSFSRSFAAAVSNEARPHTIEKNMEDKPAMVIDDDFLLDKNSKLTLVGKVKMFDSLPNLRIIFNDEGFENVIISHEGIKNWFSDDQPWTNEFRVEERVLWVDVEGIPSVACTNKTFTKIAKRWGELLFTEDPDDSKVSVIRARKIIGWNPEFMEQESETSSDSGNEEKDKNKEGEPLVSDDLSKPPGFSKVIAEENIVEEVIKIHRCQGESVLVNFKARRWDMLSMNVLSLNIQGLGPKAKKDWVKELCCKNKISFLSLQETKMEEMDDMVVRSVWGNMDFDYRYSSSVVIRKKNALELLAWGFSQMARRESSNLRDIPFGGFSFTWDVRDVSKMSKLDRFFVSDGLLCQFPALSGLILARHLSDHRLIFLRECDVDYGPIPFKTFHSWFSIEGFDQVVKDSWHNDVVVDLNEMSYLKKKFQILKKKIKIWVHQYRVQANDKRKEIHENLQSIDKLIDQDGGQEDLLNSRRDL
ncbi:RNA-directed DNA polymerase, eukaryota [Tanacetum coccineum]